MNRRALLAKVHIGAKAMGWDTQAYRDILRGRFGVGSAADLTDRQLEEFCDYLKSQGIVFKSKKQTNNKENYYRLPKGDLNAQKRYIAALWKKLDFKMSGLDTRCKKQFNVDKFIWLKDQNHLQILAKDLWNRCQKKGLDPRPNSQN